MRTSLFRKSFFMASVPVPTYPQTRRCPVDVETFGVKYSDPYRWLEDLDSEETKAWVESQMALTRSFLDDDQFKSMREDVMSRLKMHYTYDKKGLPFRIGGNWFHYCTKGLQNQSVLYITGPTADGTPEVFYDVNTESSDGTTSISRLSAERTGFHYGLIGLRERGSDWSTFYWFDSARRGPIRPSTVSSGSNDLGIDVVKGKFISTSLVNRPSRTGYFYSSYPTPVTTEVLRKRGLWCEAASTPTDSATSKDTNYAAWYHADGTSQANDVPIFLLRGREADWFYGASVTTDGRFVVVDASDGCDPSTNIYVSAFDAAPLEACARARRDARLPTATDAERSAVAGPPVAPELNFLTLVTGMDTAWTYVHNYTDGDEEVFLFVTNRPSPKKQLRAIRVPLKAFATAPRTPVGDEPPLAPGMRIVDVIAADDHEVLDYVTPGCGGKFLIVAHTVDVCDCISIYALDGKLVRRLRLPVGTITGTSCSVLHEHVFFRIGSYVSPGTDLYMDTSAPAFQAALAGGPQADGPVVQGVTLDEFVQAVGNVRNPSLLHASWPLGCYPWRRGCSAYMSTCPWYVASLVQTPPPPVTAGEGAGLQPRRLHDGARLLRVDRRYQDPPLHHPPHRHRAVLGN